MALIEKNLRRLGHGGVIAAGSANVNSTWSLFTNDADTVVEAANFFNGEAARLTKGDQIQASLDLDGTPEVKHYIVTSITAGVVVVTAMKIV